MSRTIRWIKRDGLWVAGLATFGGLYLLWVGLHLSGACGCH